MTLHDRIGSMIEAAGEHFAAGRLDDAARTLREAADWILPRAEPVECPNSPNGRHQVDTSMESGPNNCFHCERPMK